MFLDVGKIQAIRLKTLVTALCYYIADVLPTWPYSNTKAEHSICMFGVIGQTYCGFIFWEKMTLNHC